jgi:metallophosphoesterase superfamily enzyme
MLAGISASVYAIGHNHPAVQALQSEGVENQLN